MSGERSITSQDVTIQAPPSIAALFNDVRLSWVWMALRLYLGWHFLSAGWVKYSSPAWLENGEALKLFWAESLTMPTQGTHFTICPWYKTALDFLVQGGHYAWLSRLVISGEIVVGLALLVGSLTGLAALLASFACWNQLMCGCTGANVSIFPLTLLLALAWKTAGYQGLDRFILPKVGALWSHRATTNAPTTQSPDGDRRTSA